MKLIILLAIVLNLNGVFSVFLAPGILEQKPANRTLCQSNRIQNRQTQPYIECGTGSSIRIVSAVQLPTRRIDQCPEQALNTPTLIPVLDAQCRTPIDNNLTAILQDTCNFRESCVFTFQNLAPNGLRCLVQPAGAANPAIATVTNNLTYLQVVFFCDNPRRKFRPFSNKRFDPKFSASLFHTVRHPSNNRFVPI